MLHETLARVLGERRRKSARRKTERSGRGEMREKKERQRGSWVIKDSDKTDIIGLVRIRLLAHVLCDPDRSSYGPWEDEWWKKLKWERDLAERLCATIFEENHEMELIFCALLEKIISGGSFSFFFFFSYSSPHLVKLLFHDKLLKIRFYFSVI